MAIADTITSMQTHTSNAYTMIGYGTDLTGTNKNLENLSTSIFKAFIESLNNPSTLFNNLPKITGTGTTITLNNTIEAPMKIELSPSELTQDGTPTPSSPQDIHTISGDNTIRVEGKNLIPITNQDFTLSGIRFQAIDGSIKISGTATANITGFNMKNDSYFPITLEAGAYYLTRGSINSNVTVNVVTSIGEQTLAQLPRTETTYSTSFTLNSTTKVYLGVFIPSGANITAGYMGNIMISKSGGDYEPYKGTDYSIDLKSKNLAITGWADRFVEAINSRSNVYLINRDNRYCLRYNPSAGYGSYDTKNLTLGVTFKPNTQYTVSYDILKESSTSKTVAFHYTDGTWETPSSEVSATDIWVHQTITSSASKTVDYIAPYYTNGNTYIDINTFMINKGTTALPYQEYYDYGFYGSIGNYEDKFIRTSGKNLFEGTLVNKTFITTDGSMVSAGNRVAIENYITLSNGTYTINSNKEVVVYVYDTSNNFVSDESFISWNNVPFTFNITGTKKIRVGFRNSDNSNISPSDVTNIMLNKGTALPYEPYGTDEWYIKKNIGKVVLDENVEFTIDNTNQRIVYGLIKNLIVIPASEGTKLEAVCNNLETKSFQNVYNSKQQGIASSSTGNLSIHIDGVTDTGSLTEAQFQTWLSTNNIILYYLLKTPTYTPITGTLAEQLEAVKKSKDGVTNISQINNDLPFVLDVSAIEELESVGE